MTTPPTPGQTIGPFFGFSLPYDGGPALAPAGHPDAVRVHGFVLDGAGEPVPDALLELRQADATGAVPRAAGSLHRDGYTFTGWGRAATDATGHYSFTTLLPGAGHGAPFFAVTVFARGLLDRLFTRIYLPGHEAAWESDAVLRSLPPDRRDTLTARRDSDGLRFDVRLQGDGETVFLAFPA